MCVRRCVHNGEIVPLDDIMLRKIKRVTDTLNRRAARGCGGNEIPASASKEITSGRMDPT